MAKKEESKVESRVLSKVMGGLGAFIAADDTITVNGDGWTYETFTVGPTTFLAIVNLQKFDLSGYQLQDKTLFPQSVLFQDMNRGPGSSTPANLQRVTVLSTTPLSLSDFTSINSSTTQWNVPGSLRSTFELQNILSARYQDYVTLTTLAGVQPMKESAYGSGTSTAGEAIWYADAYLLPIGLGNAINLTFPDAAVVIPSAIYKEDELEYIMRLARSVEPIY